MNEMLETATKPLKEGYGGGHIPAAGGKIRKVDRKKFKENVKKYIEKIRKS
jgi:nanoRNase/pAp phosphatase (c-di-AMP/oligoRNAs hydrolase)